jgi:hypothetical protein
MWSLRSRGERLPASDRRRIDTEILSYGVDKNARRVHGFAVCQDNGIIEREAESLGIHAL